MLTWSNLPQPWGKASLLHCCSQHQIQFESSPPHHLACNPTCSTALSALRRISTVPKIAKGDPLYLEFILRTSTATFPTPKPGRSAHHHYSDNNKNNNTTSLA